MIRVGESGRIDAPGRALVIRKAIATETASGSPLRSPVIDGICRSCLHSGRDPDVALPLPGIPLSMHWLTIQEAAELLRVRVSWLYERTRTNAVPHVKLGKYLRFDRDELLSWARSFGRDGAGRDPLRPTGFRPPRSPH